MTDYADPSRWLICHYRPGSGGKFLCSALMTIDCVAHWDKTVENGNQTYQQWAKQQWIPPNKDLWMPYEPISDWDLTFFSRTMDRGQDLSMEQFNQLCDKHGSEHFHAVWKSGKRILDFYHRRQLPPWWQACPIVSLDADINDPVYRRFLLNKIYPWDPVTGVGTVMMDKPMPEMKYKNAIKYQNQWQFGPFKSADLWLDWIYQKDARLHFHIESPMVQINDLLQWNTVLDVVSSISHELKSDFNRDDLNCVWSHWMESNRHFN